MPRILLEVCVDSPAGFKAAVEGGADRIELCSSLSVGGLTPSPGFMAFAGKAARPSRAMIRPRVGSYVFSEDETDMMRRDIDAARAAGLAGVVIGANLVSGQLDEKTTARLAKHAAGLEMTLHRSVDLMPHPMEAVDVAIGLGFRTILTSGGQLKAPDGAEIVAAMVMQAGDRLEILGGSGLNPGNVVSFIKKTGVSAVHGSFSAPWQEIDQNLVRFGFIGNDARETSRAIISQVRAAIDSQA
jgi:copper homeostasis protein